MARRQHVFFSRIAPYLVLSLCLCVSVVPFPALAQDPANEAVVIVDFGDGRVESHCVTFSEASISGMDLLSRAGVAVGAGSGVVGTSVCKIGDTGCEAGQNCFCQCQGVDCHYWTYFQWQDGAWVYSPIGGSQRQVVDGAADAWFWSDGKTLPKLSPAGICGSLAAAPTVVAPTDTPLAAMTVTPSDTPAPTATATEPPVATASATPAAAQAATEVPLATPEATDAATPSPTSDPATATLTATAAATATTAPTAAATTPADTPTAAPTEASTPTAGSGSSLLAVAGWVALAVVLAVVAVAMARRR